MALNIKNEEAQRLSRELATLTGESITTAVTVAVSERLGRVRAERAPASDRAAYIHQLGQQISVALAKSPLQVEDLYGRDGLPR